ncbi:DUF6807 domain-containing protein [Humisphaera borealis]|uniref:PmoA family protein n=1 Tax=Humisphaera borealis TaxID=2807512 RepID=A0A7M2X2F6_9BACT|nr:PmoA family protein [Humisphaera borealis]QOV91854.1 PmoA family protein [Humisphaera borealis]
MKRLQSAFAITVSCLALWAGIAAPAAADVVKHPGTIIVHAGDIDRTDTVVSFMTDPASAGSYPELAAADGGPTLPLQIRPDGRACFVVPELKAGQSRTYNVLMIKRSEAPPDKATANQKDGAIAVKVGVNDVLVYRGEKTPLPAGFEPQYARGGYIHPLLTPAGVATTDDYPPNHKHHHGVWSPWTKTEFEGRKPDFWNMGGKTGTVEFVAFDKTWSGRVAAGFTTTHRFIDLTAKPEPKPALNETWQVDAYAVGGDKAAYHVFDFQSTQTTAGQSPLNLPKYHYGGLGLRGNRQWDGEANSQYLTSEGKNRADGNDTRARWLIQSGKVDGKAVYTAVLCSPENFRFPQPVRLHPKEPFACFAPQMLGDMAIEPGKPYVMKYRFIVGDGEPDAKLIERLWHDYASPAKVDVK